MDQSRKLIKTIREILYDSIDGIHEGQCKRFTLLKLEESLDFLARLEKHLEEKPQGPPIK